MRTHRWSGMLQIPLHPASNAARHVVSHADLGEQRKFSSPSCLNRGTTFQAASSSQQLSFLEINRFRTDGLTRSLAPTCDRPGSARR